MSSVKEKLKRIFGYRKFFSSDECTIDSLIRIDDEAVGYICEGCILTDTVRIRREDMLGKGMYPLCPLEVKGDIRVLKWVIE